MIVFIVNISVDAWKNLHNISEFSDAHNIQFEQLRRIFEADIPGFLGYEIQVGSIKVLFNNQNNANQLIIAIQNNLPLISDMLLPIEATVILPEVFRNSYIVKVD